jgi:hypothetical protein
LPWQEKVDRWRREKGCRMTCVFPRQRKHPQDAS